MRLLLLGILLLTAVPGLADAPDAKIRELVRLMEPEAAFKVGVEVSVGQQYEASLAELDAIAAERPEKAAEVEIRRKELDEAYQKLLELLFKHIDFDRYLDQVIVPLFREHFSEAEIDALLVFYRSPAGRRQVELLPKMARASSDAAKEFFEPALAKVQQEMMGDADATEQAFRTLAAMRGIATAMGEYRVYFPKGRFPAVTTVAELQPLVEEFSDSKLEPNDSWGTPFAIVVSEDGMRYRLISAGADGVFEADSRTLQSSAPGPEFGTVFTETYEADLVYEGWGGLEEEAMFVQAPRQVRVGGERVKR